MLEDATSTATATGTASATATFSARASATATPATTAATTTTTTTTTTLQSSGCEGGDVTAPQDRADSILPRGYVIVAECIGPVGWVGSPTAEESLAARVARVRESGRLSRSVPPGLVRLVGSGPSGRLGGVIGQVGRVGLVGLGWSDGLVGSLVGLWGGVGLVRSGRVGRLLA